jgi:hypothetical protein
MPQTQSSRLVCQALVQLAMTSITVTPANQTIAIGNQVAGIGLATGLVDGAATIVATK